MANSLLPDAPDQLDADARRRWDDLGVVVLRGVLPRPSVQDITGWVDELAETPETPEGPMHHHEQTDGGPAIARTERFAGVHARLGAFVLEDVASLVGEVVGEPVVLFKEKVNYKHPGGGGFAPHQDARAYRFADRHFSVMVPMDPATEQSGCLWFADNPGRSLLPVDERGRIAPETVDSLDWYPVEVHPGDLVVFDSAAPHQSHTNESPNPRRAMYLTYNLAADGDLRDAYYADKDAEFAGADGTFGGDRVRISISDDFLGRPVEPTAESGGENPDTEDPVAALEAMYSSERAGHLYDEAVTELEHGLQAAALAEAEGAPAELVAAALLHDVGHLIAGDLVAIDEDLVSDARHEGVGAGWLRPHFGAPVADPVALHVSAKRYLCATDPAYAGELSASSVRSLAVQGGPMDPEEVRAFESNRHHDAAVRLRRWDDLAKVAGARTPPFSHYVPMLRSLASGHSGR